MSDTKPNHTLRGIAAGLAALALLAPPRAHAQDRATFNIYGFAMADAIVDFMTNNPDWYDTARPSRLPAFDDQFGEDGHFYLSARQSRFGVKASVPAGSSAIKAQFEFDLFGVGRDAGLTTIRLRHAWGQYKQIGAGQTNSVFMDIDVFPNTVEYWGPNGMLFFRNIQVFWRPLDDGKSKATIAIENPGGSGDLGVVAERIELSNVRARYPVPDLSAEYRYGADWGYVEGAGIVGWFKWDDLNTNDVFDLSGDAVRWGFSLSSNIKPSSHDVLRLQGIYGEGIENYFNDAPIDLAAERNLGDVVTPVDGRALPIFGMSAYLDHNWNDHFSTAIGYSRNDVDNSDLQTANAFHSGQYASTNLLWAPYPKVMMGGEFLWVRRDNNSDGFTADDFRLQFSFKYNFDVSIGG